MLLAEARASSSSLSWGYIVTRGVTAAVIMLALPVPVAMARAWGLKKGIVDATKEERKLQKRAPKTVPVT